MIAAKKPSALPPAEQVALTLSLADAVELSSRGESVRALLILRQRKAESLARSAGSHYADALRCGWDELEALISARCSAD
jgi:hypothetical protein